MVPKHHIHRGALVYGLVVGLLVASLCYATGGCWRCSLIAFTGTGFGLYQWLGHKIGYDKLREIYRRASQ